jgi:hypothetical protein
MLADNISNDFQDPFYLEREERCQQVYFNFFISMSEDFK